MQDIKQKKRPLGILAVGISIMSILYGWIAYADDEISSDTARIVDNITAGYLAAGKTITIDTFNQQLLNQVSTQINMQQNSEMNTELYGSSDIAPADAMLTRHFSSYCSPLTSIVPGIAGNCPVDPLKQFGDVKVSSILTGTAYDSFRAQAAQDFLTNLLSPPAGSGITNFQANMPINVATITQSPDLKNSFVKALSDEAVLSVVRLPFAEMIAKRTVVEGSNISEMQLMEQQAIQRFMSSGWAANLNTLQQPQDVAKDQALMQAYQVWMDYQRYRQMERVEALLAVLVLQNFRMSKAASSSGNPPSSDQVNNAVQQASGSNSTTSGSDSSSQ